MEDLVGFLFDGGPCFFVWIPCDVYLINALADFAGLLETLELLEVVLQLVDATEPGFLLVLGVLAHRGNVIFVRGLLRLRLQ